MRYPALILLTLLSWLVSHDAAVPYFTNVRDVAVSSPNQQNYVVVDPEIWNHARRDLADLRLYDGENQLPYVLRQQGPRVSSVEQEAKILNLGTVGDHTEFDLDVKGASEYDRVRLQLDAKDFVNSALIFGKNDLASTSRTQLGPSTLYDFSREKLGSNFILSLPPSSFLYLHIQLAAGIRPEQVKGATIFDLQEKKASRVQVGNCGAPAQKHKQTIIQCDVPSHVPLDRLQFNVAPDEVNFRRPVTIANAGSDQIASGDISRIRLTRGGHTVTSEDVSVDLSSPHHDHLTVTIENGDDPPLQLASVQPLAVERRIYFDPGGKNSLKLYYGDEKLEPPVYDYAKFFQESPNAVLAQLGPGMHNPAYSGRPDERPWSDRHQALLWVAMLLAVAVLAVTAFRSLKSGAKTTSD
jgi:Protein of unknown function (DUF3999)